jgi:hypothetical protein
MISGTSASLPKCLFYFCCHRIDWIAVAYLYKWSHQDLPFCSALPVFLEKKMLESERVVMIDESRRMMPT